VPLPSNSQRNCIEGGEQFKQRVLVPRIGALKNTGCCHPRVLRRTMMKASRPASSLAPALRSKRLNLGGLGLLLVIAPRRTESGGDEFQRGAPREVQRVGIRPVRQQERHGARIRSLDFPVQQVSPVRS